MIDSLTPQEELWRKQMVDGTADGRIPQGESMTELATRMHAALTECLKLPQGSKPLIVSHGICAGVPDRDGIRVTGLCRAPSAFAQLLVVTRRLSTKARGWLRAGLWKARAISRIWTCPHWMSYSANGGSGSDSRNGSRWVAEADAGHLADRSAQYRALCGGSVPMLAGKCRTVSG
ncbi:phosphoglycerate mutase [Serratia fonticola]|uniref:Phosphoglycerate mutase n=1 Tax=Serratia fonticola TaxID=47917 RepID=A0A4U9UFD6_SERFO|nr:phosphoglycerate mutase [Serratia fonticola]